jgi:hypothetical protein
MDQVNELLEMIQALTLMGVTGASVMYSFFERRIQPLQKRCPFGFDYLESEHMSGEELLPGEALKRVGHVLMDVHAVPYASSLFYAKNHTPRRCSMPRTSRNRQATHSS